MVVVRRMTSWTRLLRSNQSLFRVPRRLPSFPARRPHSKNPPNEAAVLCNSTGAELAAARVRRMAFPVWFEANTLNEEKVEASSRPVVKVTMKSGRRRVSEAIVCLKKGVRVGRHGPSSVTSATSHVSFDAGQVGGRDGPLESAAIDAK